MSTYQMVVRSTASVFQGISVAAICERFLNWWVSLYANPPRKLPPLI
jgi:hypothetical protein